MQGKVMPLTPRELQVLQALAEGKSPKQIAISFGICRDTVSVHIHNIKLKLNASTREEAVALACFCGLVAPVNHPIPTIP